MSTLQHSIIKDDPWSELKDFTDARIALGRCGGSLPVKESLAFKLAHAKARDAVLQPMQTQRLLAQLAEAGHPALHLHSSVADRAEYLTRPDKGRRLNQASLQHLQEQERGYDLSIVVSDGLSSRAIHENVVEFVTMFMEQAAKAGLRVAPLCVVEHGRVAIADEVGETLDAKLAVILIGERPGLSSPNSLGVYMTYNPRLGATDEARNCISNVRQGGLPVAEGVRKLAYLVESAFHMRKSGVMLKDKMGADYLPFSQGAMITD